MEGVRETPLRGVVVPLLRRSLSSGPKPKVKRVRRVLRGEGEVLELFGERRGDVPPVTELRDRMPPYRLF